ncbi:1-phosphatidylinositol phosphodiesterase [Vanrija pseudolonga]|uniref:1-phosphatidylinositol phosphodiesterase n=1 Tax=Vanrija pseudolonga TaxID=143232 RepID=A0AAF0Y4T1_9TREE|nr:1-phosphatidylinositol phosphodiesterase [Vanrija pseudolonga]
MSLKVVAYGVHVRTAVAPDGPGAALETRSTAQGLEVNVDNIAMRGGDPVVVIAFVLPTASGDKVDGSVTVQINQLPHVRRRGWLSLEPSIEGVLAYYLLDPESAGTVILFRNPGTRDFLAQLNDNTPIGDLTLPGTHESCALYGFFISQCQQTATPVAQQLIDGVRFLDVRLKVEKGRLETYHGIRPERSTLKAELDAIESFFVQHPRETVIVSIKEETPPWHPDFSQMVYNEFKSYGDRWRFAETVPTLGEARGKGIIFTRFDRSNDNEWPEGMGIHPTTWPDSRREGFEWDCKGTTVKTQDWYRVDSFIEIPEKTEVVINSLAPTLSPQQGLPWTISFASASRFPMAPPQWMAKGVGFPTWGLGVDGVNGRVTKWLLEQAAAGKRPRATLLTDFYHQAGDGSASIAELLVALNFINN